MSTHAKFSPSAASRWMVCPKSVQLTAELKPVASEHNVYTAQGTVVHALGEIALREELLNGGDAGGIFEEAGKSAWGRYCKDLGDEYGEMPVTPEMVEMARDYLRHVWSLVCPDDVIGIESKLVWNENLFGTADLVLINADMLTLCDLKAGSGNRVSPVENKQLMTYAGMALKTLSHDVKSVRLVIIQPPDENQLKVWETTSEDIRQHMAEVEGAMKSSHIEAGDHCKYCPVRASCPELHGMATNAASQSLDGLTPDQWADTLKLAAVLKPWCDSVASRAHQLAAEEGLAVPGYKLVQKYGRKTWESEKAAQFEIIKALDDAEGETPDIFNPAKLRTPTQLKKELKDFIGKDVIESLTHVPVRGTLLVPLKDKRPAIDTGENLLAAAEQLALFS